MQLIDQKDLYRDSQFINKKEDQPRALCGHHYVVIFNKLSFKTLMANRTIEWALFLEQEMNGLKFWAAICSLRLSKLYTEWMTRCAVRRINPPKPLSQVGQLNFFFC